MIDICLIVNLKEEPALCCDLQWPAMPRIGDHVKLPTHAEWTFTVKSVEWAMDGSARVMLGPKVDVKFRKDLMDGLDPWKHPMEISTYPRWREYYPEKGWSTPYRK